MTPRLPELALQYVSTNGACHAFARAALRLPTTRGAVLAEIEDDERDHAFLLLPDGRALDAEGVRDVRDMARDFGLPADTRPVIREEVTPRADGYVDLLADHLVTLGWDRSLPEHDPARCATRNWAAARREFERLGGWNGSPVDLLSKLARNHRAST